ncbi:MAG: lytic transglycosylase domain-containing protein [Clostridia bacterium]|nr:lytic transglycosylase domain-containing protein [Clostridia bacterium]
MKVRNFLIVCALFFVAAIALYFGVKTRFPQPYRREVEDSGMEPFLVYSVIKAESGFDERAVSRSGAVGLMQLRPSTAQFVCERAKIPYDEARLKEGEYNVRLGCLYLEYLLGRFPVLETALAAYNAGEGTVSDWLKDPSCSPDGLSLARIPYGETRAYVKKVINFWKIYEFYY